jgi:hypothetical protein
MNQFRIIAFEARTVVLEQLKNSGSLRYFKNAELQQLIGELLVAVYNINERQRLEAEIGMDYINPLFVNHYDFNFDRELRKGDLSIDIAVANYEKSSDSIPFHFHSLKNLTGREPSMHWAFILSLH